jgi:hypothetical protein
MDIKRAKVVRHVDDVKNSVLFYKMEEKRKPNKKGKKSVAAAGQKKKSRRTKTAALPMAVFHSSQAGVAVMKGSKKCPKDGCKRDNEIANFQGLVTINTQGPVAVAPASSSTAPASSSTAPDVKHAAPGAKHPPNHMHRPSIHRRSHTIRRQI